MNTQKMSLFVMTALLSCFGGHVSASHICKQGLATAALATAVLMDTPKETKENNVFTNRKGQTFTFHGHGMVSVQDVFGIDLLDKYRTNNDHPLPTQSITFIQEDGQSGVFVGLGLKGGDYFRDWVSKIGLEERHYQALIKHGFTETNSLYGYKTWELEEVCKKCGIEEPFKNLFIKAVLVLEVDTWWNDT